MSKRVKYLIPGDVIMVNGKPAAVERVETTGRHCTVHHSLGYFCCDSYSEILLETKKVEAR